MKTYIKDKPQTKARLVKKLEKKKESLARLERLYSEATGKSKASYKGKITRCKADIEILKHQINN